MPRARRSTSLAQRRICRRRSLVAVRADRALLALQGPQRRRSAGAASARKRRRLGFMTATGSRVAGIAAGCRAPATPARTASRSRSRPAMPQRCSTACSATRCSRSASVRAIRCGSRRAFASTATISTRPRARVEAGLGWSIGKRRRARAASSARAGSCGSWPRAGAPARRPHARGPGAGARRHRDPQ